MFSLMFWNKVKHLIRLRPTFSLLHALKCYLPLPVVLKEQRLACSLPFTSMETLRVFALQSPTQRPQRGGG